MGILLAVVLWTSQVAPAEPLDRAVLIGVTHAPKMAMQALNGPPNDVADLTTVMRARGFHVEFLNEEKATRQAILDLIAKEGKLVGKDGKFVVYFSGHGYKQAGTLPTILPWDATPTSQLISVRELYQAVSGATNAGSRTVLIDACYSGGLILKNAATPGATAASRGFSPPDEAGQHNGVILKNAQPAGLVRKGSDGNEAQKDVTYFVAAGEEEQAWEDQIGPDKTYRGFFSYSLGQALRNRDTLSWAELERQVRQDVSEFMSKYRPDQHQEPAASSGIGPVEVFGSRKLTIKSRVPQIIDVLLEQRPDPSLTLKANTDNPEVPAGDSVEFTVHTTKKGYLFVVSEEGSKASLYWPVSAGAFDLKSAQVNENVDIVLGSKDTKGTRFLRFGPNRLTAVYFNDQEEASLFVNAFLKKNPQELKKQFAKIPDYVTASYTANVTNKLVGGLIVTDPKPIYEALKDDFDWRVCKAIDAAEKSGDEAGYCAAVVCGTNSLFRTLASRSRFDLPRDWDALSVSPEAKERLQMALDGKLTEEQKALLLGVFLASKAPKGFESPPPVQAGS